MFSLHIFSEVCCDFLMSSVSLTLLFSAFRTLVFSLHFPVFLTLLSFLSSRPQSEDKVKPVLVVSGHLHALEHVVRQDYFPKENVAVLEAFLSR